MSGRFDTAYRAPTRQLKTPLGADPLAAGPIVWTAARRFEGLRETFNTRRFVNPKTVVVLC